MDLKDILLKTSTQLNDTERDFLRENKDKLSEEDLAAYEFLNDVPEQPEPPKEPETPQEPAPPSPPVFRTEEDARNFVRAEQERFEKEKQEALKKAKTSEEKKYIEDNFSPKSWDDVGNKMVEVVEKRMEEKQVANTKKQEEARKKAEEDWQALRKEHNLEGINTDEGLKVHNQIVDIAVKHGKHTFKDAYELWSIIPEDHGGGYKTPDAAAELAKQKKAKMDAQKKAASKIGGKNPGDGGGNAGSSPIKPLTYEELKNKSRSRIIKEALSG